MQNRKKLQTAAINLPSYIFRIHTLIPVASFFIHFVVNFCQLYEQGKVNIVFLFHFLKIDIREGDLIWKFAKILWWQNCFLHLWQDKPLWVELKTNGGVIFINILLHFHYFISLETPNIQKSEVFLQ